MAAELTVIRGRSSVSSRTAGNEMEAVLVVTANVESTSTQDADIGPASAHIHVS